MKKLAGAIGFVMLGFVPSEKAMDASMRNALIGWAIWACVAIVLLAMAGAFKRRTSTSKISKT